MFDQKDIILDFRNLSPNPIWSDKHKLFKKKFDQKPFEKRFYRKRRDGVVKRRNAW
jgi:hypothetical protein